MRQIRKLPRDTGVTGWNAILGPAPAYPEAEGAISADWLVIGGGFAGLSAAKRLCELRGGDRIVLLEAARIGEGPAGRNSGFMIDLPHELSGDGYAGSADGDRLQISLNRHAQNFARSCAAEYEMPAEAVSPIGRINGAVNVVLITALLLTIPLFAGRDAGGGLPTPASVRAVPWWALLGGAIGASVVLVQLTAAPKLGAALLVAVFVGGTALGSILCDRFGLAGYAKVDIHPERWLGMALVVAGVVLVARPWAKA